MDSNTIMDTSRSACCLYLGGILRYLLLLLFAFSAQAKDFQTNALNVKNAPKWVKRTKVEKVTDRIQMKLEWTVRRVNMFWHSTPKSFAAAQNLGDRALAVTTIRNGEVAIHMGPRVNKDNYQQVVGHELVHVIVYQKYKSAIPKWLEEGLANHLSKKRKVDYGWLAQQELPSSMNDLAHPFKGSPERIAFRYVASQAFAEMLDRKCDLQQLINLSVERKMEDYIVRTCEIKDLAGAFKSWVKKKAG